MSDQKDVAGMIADVASRCAATHARMRARTLTRAYDAALAEAGLRSTEYAVLVAVGAAEAGRMHAIAEMLSMDLSTLSRSLRNLVKHGWVVIAADGHRTKRATLTVEGLNKVAEGYPHWLTIQSLTEQG